METHTLRIQHAWDHAAMRCETLKRAAKYDNTSVYATSGAGAAKLLFLQRVVGRMRTAALGHGRPDRKCCTKADGSKDVECEGVRHRNQRNKYHIPQYLLVLPLDYDCPLLEKYSYLDRLDIPRAREA